MGTISDSFFSSLSLHSISFIHFFTHVLEKVIQTYDSKKFYNIQKWASQVVVIQNLPANEGDIRDMGLIPRSGRSSGRGHGNPLQYSYLENPMDRGAWSTIVHRVAQSQTQLCNLECMHAGDYWGTQQSVLLESARLRMEVHLYKAVIWEGRVSQACLSVFLYNRV